MKCCALCGGDMSGLRSDAKVCRPCKPRAMLLKTQAWYAANKERRRAYDERRRAEKRELYRAASKRNRQRRPDQKAAETGLRRKRSRHATPAWADRKAIKALYLQARIKTRETGQPWHVDHVIPLRGKTVCGLHVAENLCVVPAAENLRKGNHYSLRFGGIA